MIPTPAQISEAFLSLLKITALKITSAQHLLEWERWDVTMMCSLFWHKVGRIH